MRNRPRPGLEAPQVLGPCQPCILGQSVPLPTLRMNDESTDLERSHARVCLSSWVPRSRATFPRASQLRPRRRACRNTTAGRVQQASLPVSIPCVIPFPWPSILGCVQPSPTPIYLQGQACGSTTRLTHPTPLPQPSSLSSSPSCPVASNFIAHHAPSLLLRRS